MGRTPKLSELGLNGLAVGPFETDAVTLQRGRPGLATLLMSEDRPAVAAELRALAALPKDVDVVVAHDPVALERDLKARLYRQGFEGI